jgi:hypothetical protein
MSSARWWMACLWLACGAPLFAAGSGSEYEIKAAFLYKFASFVEWPNDDRALPVGLCVLGVDPFGDSLEDVVKGKSINGRGFLVRRLKAGDAVTDCHILFIGASEQRTLSMILARLRGSPLLTVGDVAEFCQNGGAINLVLSDHRVHLEINPAAAERARLQLSSRLLSLARIVRENPKGTR